MGREESQQSGTPNIGATLFTQPNQFRGDETEQSFSNDSINLRLRKKKSKTGKEKVIDLQIEEGESSGTSSTFSETQDQSLIVELNSSEGSSSSSGSSKLPYFKSIFEPTMLVTEDNFALSICKKEYNTTGHPEHAFLILQATTFTKRWELCKDIKYPNNGTAEIKATQKDFLNEEQLLTKLIKLVWGSYPPPGKPFDKLRRNTHGITYEQFLNLESIIELDIDGKSIIYFFGGQKSIFRPGQLKLKVAEHLKSSITTFTMLGTVAMYAIVKHFRSSNKNLIKKVFDHMPIVVFIILLSCIIPYYADMKHKKFTENDFQNIPYHNCISWAEEKMNSIGIVNSEEHWLDQLFCATSPHVNGKEGWYKFFLTLNGRNYDSVISYRKNVNKFKKFIEKYLAASEKEGDEIIDLTCDLNIAGDSFLSYELNDDELTLNDNSEQVEPIGEVLLTSTNNFRQRVSNNVEQKSKGL